MSKSSNAQRFIQAYNEIDHSLRTIYGFKRSLTYADLIRKAVTLNAVIRKYEETLIDYGRLRNSIVHKSNPNYVIAEPHDDVVEEFEKIAKLVATPPKAIDKVCERNVMCISHDSTVRSAIELIAETGYSNIPVYNGNLLLGVVNRSILIEVLGLESKNGGSLDDKANNTILQDIMADSEKRIYYKVADRNISVEKALDMFYAERKLEAVLITPKGTYEELPIGIITAGDVLDMNEILENY